MTTKDGEGEDFLAFPTDTAFEETSSTSYAPDEITRSTFLRLLHRYPETVKEVYTRKIIKKAQPHQTKKERKRAIAENDPPPEVKIPEKQLEKSLTKLLDLDEWRYEGFPALLKERQKEQKQQLLHQEGKGAGSDPGGSKTQNKESSSPTAGMYLKKEELVRLMEWKLHHGYFRPTLMGMVNTNQGALVHKTTTAAFNSVPNRDPFEDPKEAYPKASLDTLAKALRGIGPATASLILSVATKDDNRATSNEAPFYSDELFMWLCLKIYPENEDDRHEPGEQSELAERIAEHIRKNGELNVKYNMNEYEKLWKAVQTLRSRLNRHITQSQKTTQENEEKDDEESSDDDDDDDSDSDDEETQIFTATDIEKVAYVLRYGHVPELPPREIKIMEREKELKERKAAAIAAGGSTLTKKQQKKLEKKRRKSLGLDSRNGSSKKRKWEERGKRNKDNKDSSRGPKRVKSE